MKKLTYFLIGLIMYGCTVENNGEPDKLENEKQIYEKLDFTEVPPNIKDIVLGTTKTLKERSLSHKNGEDFGEIIESNVHKVSKENGGEYYTFAMEKTSDDLVDLDNMVVTKDSLGNFSSNIIRYEQSETEKDRNNGDYSEYTGKVSIFDGKVP